MKEIEDDFEKIASDYSVIFGTNTKDSNTQTGEKPQNEDCFTFLMEELLILDPLFSQQLSFLSSFLSLARENWTKYDLPSMQLGVSLLFLSLLSLFFQLVLLRSSSSSYAPSFLLALFVFGLGGGVGVIFLPFSPILGGIVGVFLCYLLGLCFFFVSQLLLRSPLSHQHPKEEKTRNKWRGRRMVGWLGVCLVLRVISLLSNSYIEAEVEVMRFFLVSSVFLLVLEISFEHPSRYFLTTYFFSLCFFVQKTHLCI